MPQYLAAAWRSDDGGVAVAVANLSDTDLPMRFTLSREEHGLSERGRVYRLRPEDRTQLCLFENGQATIADTLPAAGAIIYEVVGNEG